MAEIGGPVPPATALMSDPARGPSKSESVREPAVAPPVVVAPPVSVAPPPVSVAPPPVSVAPPVVAPPVAAVPPVSIAPPIADSPTPAIESTRPALPPAPPRTAFIPPPASRTSRAPEPPRQPQAAVLNTTPERATAIDNRKGGRDWTPAAAFADREAASRLASSIQQQGYPVEIRQESSSRPWVVWIGAQPRAGERRR